MDTEGTMTAVTLPDRPLTHAEQQYVLGFVYGHMAPDDREPEKVVADDYKGDWEKYCRVMAGWHGLDLSQITKPAA